MADGAGDPGMEEAGRRSMMQNLDVIDTLRDRILKMGMRPGGAMARADEKTSYAPISRQVGWQLQIGVEHLVAFARLVREHGLPHYAGYVLIRASMESFVTVLWLLGPGKPADRIRRSLRLSWWFNEEANDFATKLGTDVDEFWAETRAELERLRMRVKELRQTRLDVTPISRTEMFNDVQRRFPGPGALPPLLAWRVCSALAHGNSAMAVMALKRTPIGPDDPNAHVATSSWALMDAFVTTSIWLFYRAIGRYDELSVAE